MRPKAVHKFMFTYDLVQMQCFHTKSSIPVTAFTHDVTSASKLRLSHFRRVQNEPEISFEWVLFASRSSDISPQSRLLWRNTKHYILTRNTSLYEGCPRSSWTTAVTLSFFGRFDCFLYKIHFRIKTSTFLIHRLMFPRHVSIETEEVDTGTR